MVFDLTFLLLAVSSKADVIDHLSSNFVQNLHIFFSNQFCWNFDLFFCIEVLFGKKAHKDYIILSQLPLAYKLKAEFIQDI